MNNQNALYKYIALNIYIAVLLSIPTALLAQEDPLICIRKITIEGNKTTKNETILRELTFRLGDTLPLSKLLLEDNRLRVLGLSLFRTVDLALKEMGHPIDKHLHITVTEGWYLYPIPIFELADRNFNVWWKEYKGNLNRTNIGLRTTYKNFTGRNDPLRFTVQWGFTRKYSITYTLPALNKARTLGLFVDAVTTTNKEIWYNTEKNKIKIFRDDQDIMLRRIGGTLALTYRPRLFTSHQFLASYSYFETADTVAFLNYDFLGRGKHVQRFLTLSYTFIHDTRDFRGYPRRGHHLWVSVGKNGWTKEEFQSLPLSVYAAQYIPISPQLTLELIGRFRTNLQTPQSLPYNNRRALGFEKDYLRGYEYYVIDGETFGFLKTTLRQKLFKTRVNFGNLMPIKSLRLLPIAANLTAHFDTGFANDQTNFAKNPLNNRALWSVGMGIDIIYFNDTVVMVHASMNDLKEAGLFFHLQTAL